jgi:UDP-N-acetyl-D-glucosamine dehydrogenase
MKVDPASQLFEKLDQRRAKVGVIGLGYVGLPLAVAFARAGFRTVGIDLDARKVRAINEGRSYIPDVATDEVDALRRSDRLEATDRMEVLADLDTVNICVPTPLRKSKDPDLSFIVSATEQIATYLHPGMLVILESTTYPGTTDEVVRPMLEAGGLKAGEDFFLAFSPERVDPGNPRYTTRNVPKVVGGTSEACSRLAAALYQAALDRTVAVSSTRVAEMVKLLENTFRAVNIGLVNELALMCTRLGIDVWEVVEAAATKPFGFMPFYPGPGLGGHCIPVDPFYLSWKARQSGFEARFIELAGQINGEMPHRVVDLIAQALNTRRKAINGSSVLVLGVGYKRNISDIRESPSLDVMSVLHERGALIAYSDPYVPELDASAWGGRYALRSVELDAREFRRHDAVVILTDHGGVDYEAVAADAELVIDTRNVLKTPAPHVFRLGGPGVGRTAAQMEEQWAADAH